jgi:uncharacterized membrane protein YfcA
MFDTVQGIVLLAVWAVTFVAKAWAFVDCIRRPQEAFPAVGRKSKVLWLILTGLAAATGFFWGLTLTIFGMAGIVIALVYLFDVRMRIIEITSKRW